MFQRIQSIYYSLAIVALICMSFLTIASYSTEKSGNELSFNVSAIGVDAKLDGEDEVLENYEILMEQMMEDKGLDLFFSGGMALLIAGIGLVVFVMLSFKKRTRQLKLGRFLFLLFLAVFVGIMFAVDFGQTLLEENLNVKADEFQKGYGVGMFMPIVAAAFIFLANMHVKKDINLLKSVDRIR